MTSNYPNQQLSVEVLKTESARRRWEWFHRAIALAKKSNDEAMEADEPSPASTTDDPVRRDDRQLSIAR